MKKGKNNILLGVAIGGAVGYIAASLVCQAKMKRMEAEIRRELEQSNTGFDLGDIFGRDSLLSQLGINLFAL